MLLATRCPFCETVFRLQREQLTLRRGLVRCGHCKQVFDASSSLFDVSDGVSIDKAKPVTIDDVTAHTLETLANGAQTPAPGAQPAPGERVAAEPRVEHETTRAEEAPAIHHVAAEVAEPRIEVGAPHPAAAVETPSPDIAEPSVQSGQAASPDAGTEDAPSVDAPDFRAEAWNPWAPAPDASIDGRLRHTASTIPINPVTIPRSAQPPITLELTESEPMNLEKAIARKPGEPHIEAGAEQRAGSAVDTLAEPGIAEPAGTPAASKSEPAFEATPARDLARDLHELPTHGWRAAEPLRESVETHPEQAEPGREAPLRPAFDKEWHEPSREKPNGPAFAADDGTVSPSSDQAGPRREREPYFGAPSAEPDLEPRFGAGAGAGARGQYGEPYDGPFASSPGGADDAFAVTREPREPEAKRLMWQVAGGVAAGLLGCLLLMQLAWWQRETVMVAWPDSQSLFVKACANLGCKIEPPRDIDGLLVEPSDLRQVDGPHKLELKMPLRNRFDLALAYPAVELTLLDENNNIAVRRVLWPQDYVKPGTPIAAGLPARTTQTMIVRLDTGNTVASNFRVQIFYP
ncbi:DUF3426 domain-containing protein [Paraburkholderia phymatum]|uniref:MJ0042 family finger-like protein n=1 Tax=Paraburkholderia phymatum (strain DSM 17167 / CIP 108236 / LMG 21445 / STM815) TaxID=391038 RepID=B2JH20_PARP8|nr:zinc-ribbon and DUF3426 domain-containing protein [Paraburkholderia phymatum]ACC71804.1 MJ0042 family finger-like protein [Paraburkholderia phymatum STM815]